LGSIGSTISQCQYIANLLQEHGDKREDGKLWADANNVNPRMVLLMLLSALSEFSRA
jgi:hypothetical protein